MRIIFELDADDIARFEEALERARHAVRSADEQDIVDAAKYALDHLPLAQAPGYIRQRMQQVQCLVAMLEDDAWALPAPEREEVLKTLAYVADPDDLIPDHIEVIGLLDDAIMLEMLLTDLRHLVEAYADFCNYRRGHAGPCGDTAERVRQARALGRRRQALLSRMRRRQARDEERRQASSGQAH